MVMFAVSRGCRKLLPLSIVTLTMLFLSPDQRFRIITLAYLFLPYRAIKLLLRYIFIYLILYKVFVYVFSGFLFFFSKIILSKTSNTFNLIFLQHIYEKKKEQMMSIIIFIIILLSFVIFIKFIGNSSKKKVMEINCKNWEW